MRVTFVMSAKSMTKSIREQSLDAHEQFLIFSDLRGRLKDVIKHQDKGFQDIANHRAKSLLSYIEYLKDESKGEWLRLKEEAMNKYRSKQ